MLTFKLFDRYSPEKSVIPVAGILSPEKTSRTVGLTRDYQQLRHDETYQLSRVSDSWETPYPCSSPQLDLSLYAADINVSLDPVYNLQYQLKHTTADFPDIHVYGLLDNMTVSQVKVQFLNGSDWQDTPADTDYQTVRVLLHDEDVFDKPVAISYSRRDAEVNSDNYEELVDNLTATVLPVTDYTVTLSGGKLVINVAAAGALESAGDIYVKENALNRIQAYIPTSNWYQEWYLLFRRGTFLGKDGIYSTREVTGYAPSIYQQERVSLINARTTQTRYRDVVFTQASDITVTVNGVEQSDIIQAVDARFGIIRFKNNLPPGATVLLSYRITTANWIEVRGVDFNPHNGHVIHKGNHNDGVIFWLSLLANSTMVYSFDQESGLGFDIFNNSPTPLRPRWKPLVNARTLQQATPRVIDIRPHGGGLRPQLRERVGWESFTDFGFYDGKPIENIGLVVKLPYTVFSELTNRYRTQGHSLSQSRLKAKEYITQAIKQFTPVGVNVIIQDKNGNNYFD